MKKSLITLLALFISIFVHAGEPAQVMLIGTFHFNDPGAKRQDASSCVDE